MERTVTWHGQSPDGVIENDNYKLCVPSRKHDFVMANKEDGIACARDKKVGKTVEKGENSNSLKWEVDKL